MESGIDTKENSVPVERSMLYALFAIAWFGIWVTAGLIITLAQRAGANTVIANSMGFSVAAMLMYPYFSIRMSMKAPEGRRLPNFGRWSVQWVAASVIGTFVVTRVLDTFWK